MYAWCVRLSVASVGRSTTICRASPLGCLSPTGAGHRSTDEHVAEEGEEASGAPSRSEPGLGAARSSLTYSQAEGTEPTAESLELAKSLSEMQGSGQHDTAEVCSCPQNPACHTRLHGAMASAGVLSACGCSFQAVAHRRRVRAGSRRRGLSVMVDPWD